MLTQLTYCLREWDSAFFNRRIGDINLATHNHFKDTLFDLITTKVCSDDVNLISSLNQNGFQYCEGEVTFSKMLSNQSHIDFDIADESDLPQLSSLVDGMYKYSRFKSPWFTPEEKDFFYKTWLKKAVLGQFDDVCIIFRQKKTIRGFVTLKLSSNSATIGLIGVNHLCRGQGIGCKLIQCCESYLVNKNIQLIQVATQTSNVAAINLYIKNDFLVENTSVWLYKSNSS